MSAKPLDAQQKDSQATLVVKFATEAHVELFHDDDVAYISAPVASHREIHPLRSRAARAWLAGLYFTETGKAAGSQALADATNVLEAYALRANARAVAVRMARHEGAIYLDLGTPNRSVVEVTASGWRVVYQTPMPFRRPKGLAPLPVPESGGTLAALRPFVNVGSDDDFILLVAFLLAVLRGAGPYPILVINGEHGTSKSTLTKMIRALTDPNWAPLRGEPTDARDLMIAAMNAHVVSYDNLSHLRLSDELSRLATGAGFSTRTLYENREEELFMGARPIVLNGIPELATRPDLVSRSLFVTLPPMLETSRRDEEEFWAAFEKVRPRILGALLDVVVVALKRRPFVHLDRKPRMADFAKWIVAAEPACPWEPGRFLATYAANRTGAVEAILEGDTVAETVEAITPPLASQQPWTGTATELLAAVNLRATDAQKRQKDWFQKPRQVANHLKRLAPALRDTGIHVTWDKATDRKRSRLIHLERVVLASSASSTSSEGPDLQDDSADEAPDAPSDAGPVSSAGASAPIREKANVSASPDAADPADATDPTRSNWPAAEPREAGEI